MLVSGLFSECDQVKYGTSGILTTDEVFSVLWKPSKDSSSRQPPLPMRPAGQRPDPSSGLNRTCFSYTVSN
jgi:hypothetical protein